MTKKAIILFAHGSPDPTWHKHIDLIKQQVIKKSPETKIDCAYLNFTSPDLQGSVQALASKGMNLIYVIPIFLGIGQHLKNDLPILIEQIKISHPQIKIECTPPIGENDAVINLIADIALRELLNN